MILTPDPLLCNIKQKAGTLSSGTTAFGFLLEDMLNFVVEPEADKLLMASHKIRTVLVQVHLDAYYYYWQSEAYGDPVRVHVSRITHDM